MTNRLREVGERPLYHTGNVYVELVVFTRFAVLYRLEVVDNRVNTI